MKKLSNEELLNMVKIVNMVVGKTSIPYKHIGPQDKEDIAQSIILYILESMPSFDESKSSFSTYVRNVSALKFKTYSTSLNIVKVPDNRKWRELKAGTPTNLQDRANIEEISRIAVSKDRVEDEVIEKLYIEEIPKWLNSKYERQVYFMLLEDKTQKEIMEALDVSQAMVSRHISNVRKKIRKMEEMDSTMLSTL